MSGQAQPQQQNQLAQYQQMSPWQQQPNTGGFSHQPAPSGQQPFQLNLPPHTTIMPQLIPPSSGQVPGQKPGMPYPIAPPRFRP